MADSTPPKLQPPGAGLPWWMLLAARHVVFPLAVRRMKDWAGATRPFREVGDRILAIWDALPAERLGERVLINRIGGLEDSSRYWSAAMTVEHLNIVGFGVRRGIAGLRRGEVPDRVRGTAEVKPKGELPPAEVRGRVRPAVVRSHRRPADVVGGGGEGPAPVVRPARRFPLAVRDRLAPAAAPPAGGGHPRRVEGVAGGVAGGV